jgi:hypothetical protein
MPTEISGSTGVNKITDGTVVNADMADDAIGVAELSASGTASSSTFLRGDNSWAAAGGGKVLQVVNTVYCSESNSTSSSYADLGMSATMTCASSSNKILVIVDLQGIRHYGGDTSLNAYLQKDSSNWKLMGIRLSNFDTGTPAANSVGGTGGSFLDAVGDTSAHTYKIIFSNRAGTGTVRINDDNACSSITLMEIEG